MDPRAYKALMCYVRRRILTMCYSDHSQVCLTDAELLTSRMSLASDNFILPPYPFVPVPLFLFFRYAAFPTVLRMLRHDAVQGLGPLHGSLCRRSHALHCVCPSVVLLNRVVLWLQRKIQQTELQDPWPEPWVGSENLEGCAGRSGPDGLETQICDLCFWCTVYKFIYLLIYLYIRLPEVVIYYNYT